ncbi:MAG: hypothetical protein Q4D87_06760 [Actinomycetaceae bacterium]|nr:hypothetical protein [Actinomycetaceae bacterium]
MVKTVIGIKLRSMWNNATKPMWKIFLFGFLVLYFGALAAFLVFLGLASVVEGYIFEFSQIAAVTSLFMTVAWLILPLFGMGLESSLKPHLFTPHVAPSRKFSRAMLVANIVGPGALLSMIVMLVGTVALFIAGEVALGVLSVLLIPVALFVYALVSRTLTSWVSSRTMQTQKSRDMTQLVLTVVFIAAMFAFSFVAQALGEMTSTGWFSAVLTVGQWTPLVGPFAIPFLIYTGQVIPAVLQVVYVVVIAAILGKIWHGLVVKAMIGVKTPITPQIREAIEQGRPVVDPSVVTREVDDTKASLDYALPSLRFWTKLGLSSPTAAIAARTVRDWVKDSRLAPTTIVSFFLPLLGAAVKWAEWDNMTHMAFILVFLTPITLGTTAGMLISYDSTALWLQISAGVSGRTDRFARSLGTQPLAIAVSIVDGVVAAYLLDFRYSTFALIALIYAAMLITMAGMSAITGFRALGVQPPGTSAMSTKGTSNQFLAMLIMFGLMIVSTILIAPGILALYWFGGTVLLDTLIAVGILIWGIALHVGGLMLGAFLYERNQASILSQIRSWPGH